MQETAYIIVFWNKKGDPNFPYLAQLQWPPTRPHSLRFANSEH